MELVARRPSTADLSAILALINDPDSPHRQVECRHRGDPEQPGELYDRLAEDENLVLELDDEVVAYASWQLFGNHAHLNVLSVSGRHQRQGLGTRLFEAFRERLRRDGVASYTLRAYEDSPWAMRFYAKHGLRPCTPADELVPGHEGLARYLALAISHGQWPAAGKVIFFEALDD